MGIKRALLGTGVVAALAFGGVTAMAAPAQAQPRTCVSLAIELDMEMANMHESWQAWNDWHYQQDYDNYEYWAGRVDVTMALMVFC